MQWLKSIFVDLIHRVKLLYSRIWGHNTEDRDFYLNGQKISIEEMKKLLMPKYCELCGEQMRVSRGQIAKYHKKCRKYKNDRWGFIQAKKTR